MGWTNATFGNRNKPTFGGSSNHWSESDMSESRPANANLKLWAAVQETDPKYTKGFSRTGGFKGTAVNALYLIRKATEQWGPMGLTWGVRVLDEKYQPGAEGDVVHILRAELWYPGGGKQECYGQTMFVGKNKNGTYTDEEAPKKSLTDALTKGLSWLGFSADVHSGLYDDNKYVADLREKYKDGAPQEEDEPQPLAEERIAELIGTLDRADGLVALRELTKRALAAAKEANDSSAFARIREHSVKVAKMLEEAATA